MADARPACPQCGASDPAVIEYGLFALTDKQVDAFLADGWTSTGMAISDFVWQCASCKHEWAVG